MGFVLALFVGAGAFDLDAGGRFPGLAVGIEPEGGNGASTVICDCHGATRGIDGQVAGAFAAAIRITQETEGMIRMDCECGDLVFPTDGQQNGLLGVQREEAWALVFGGANRLGEGSFFCVEFAK